MKKILSIACTILFVANTIAQTPNSWQQMQQLGIPNTVRCRGTGFSIGGKGYFGTGIGKGAHRGFKNDFWQYDPVTNAWTQKADFGGLARYSATGFSIGSKGYIGLGYDVAFYNNIDFWEYDPTTNVWTKKANFPVSSRHSATGFSIGNKGYIGLGYDYNGTKNDFWEYNPITDKWTRKADFAGTSRSGATGFSIGNKGYIGLGFDEDSKKDFWEYDPNTDIWIRKKDFEGGERYSAVSFSIGSKGYIGTGNDGNYNDKSDFWEYDPITDNWTQRANFGGTSRKGAIGFSVGNKGYVGTGENDNGVNLFSDWWKYTPDDILPLKLISFTAQHNGKTNLLNWSSSQEINSSHFDIERSSSSVAFTKIGVVKAKGGNSLQNSYTFTDLQPLKATNYYRLKITDNNGAFIYSNIKSVTNTLSFDVSITPNPVATGFINLAINTENITAITITITNIDGKVLYAQQLAEASGNFTKTINVAAFAKGVYLLKAVSGKENKVIKFVK